MVVLELSFLVRVVLELHYKEDLIHFLLINHKCEDVLHSLKLTPRFRNTPSLLWFLEHFSPDTIAVFCFDETLLSFLPSISCIRSPDLESLYSSNSLTENAIQNIFPKIVSITLDSTIPSFGDNENDSTKVASIVIANSLLLNHVNTLYGDLASIALYLEKYTEYGKYKYVHLPKIIHANSLRGYAMLYNEEIVNLLRRILLCVPDNGTHDISIVFYRQLTLKEIENSGDLFRRVKYYYIHAHTLMGEKWNEQIYCNKGKMRIEGQIYGDTKRVIDHIVDKVYPSTLFQQQVNNIYQNDIWEISKCIETYILSQSRLNEMTQFPIDMSTVKFVFLNTVFNFEFTNSFMCVEKLSIKECKNIIFDENCALPKLTSLRVLLSNDIIFKGNSNTQIESIFCYNVQQFKCTRKIDLIRKVILLYCKDFEMCELDIPNTDINTPKSKDDNKCNTNNINKSRNIYIECSENLIFCNTTFNQILIFDSDSTVSNDLDDLNEKTNYSMRRFVPMTDGVEVENGIITEKMHDSETLDMVVSRYLSTYNITDNLVVRNINKKEVDVIKGISYFEISVEGYSVISIGLIDQINYREFEGSQVGWRKHSVAMHSDDGKIFFDGKTIENVNEKKCAFASVTGVKKTVGCGFIMNTKEAFFTVESELMCKVKTDFTLVSAAIGFRITNPITVNYGKRPFVFDLKTIDKDI
ncbi:hypothetical protein EIN_265140 [Entamoeba invadens IP1]|uniref:SPRY domain-containing protein n=1 Tax=Entamoeba invadens IP1 TaxID=370355 RepID=A0A0A1TWV3_ENTIV|nr:hypothetical protein EIN_265140 [Entamoeba invadens IP1]ELP85707.1 hypothetical protein EIN_265140 [Entamoeba invadens IP1]|eukprot:XP_004185053.1 hypothetical protein EIN_265140 [Entamoeba invadens IP1]